MLTIQRASLTVVLGVVLQIGRYAILIIPNGGFPEKISYSITPHGMIFKLTIIIFSFGPGSPPRYASWRERWVRFAT